MMSKIIKWIIWFAAAAILFFTGLAFRLNSLSGSRYVRASGNLLMFMGIILFGALIVVFVLKNFIGNDRPKRSNNN